MVPNRSTRTPQRIAIRRRGNRRSPPTATQTHAFPKSDEWAPCTSGCYSCSNPNVCSPSLTHGSRPRARYIELFRYSLPSGRSTADKNRVLTRPMGGLAAMPPQFPSAFSYLRHASDVLGYRASRMTSPMLLSCLQAQEELRGGGPVEGGLKYGRARFGLASVACRKQPG